MQSDSIRNLVLVLGDQLDPGSSALKDIDSNLDAVWMAEVAEENTHVWCHKLRIASFLSAMRHFRDELAKRGLRVLYHELQTDPAHDRGTSFAEVMISDVAAYSPKKIVVVDPGDYRVRHQLQAAADDSGTPIEFREDTHFYCSIEQFAAYADGRKSLLMEFFYRHMRRTHGVLMDETGEPEGGQWNFDHDNRRSFGRSGPPDIPAQKSFRRDATTQQVLDLVNQRFADHPGSAEKLSVPITRRQAKAALKHFVEHLLPQFGQWEDAMWTDEAFLFHSRLSVPLNLKLLNPRECVNAAVDAWRTGKAPLNSVEGFVRQILGWREFIRGVYWVNMPEYEGLNHLNHQRELPSFFWDGDTEMNCVRQSMQHVLTDAYSHHIQRLMVLGNFAQLWGVHPKKFHDWHMAMYLDAVDWVSLPNTLGMSQFGDGGVVGTKPYCSGGNYINKMSNFCSGCRFNPRERTGEDACPFTTLYWEFLDRHTDRLSSNARMQMPLKNLGRLRQQGDLEAVRARAAELHAAWDHA